MDIHDHFVHRDFHFLGQCFDDAQICLMWDHPIDIERAQVIATVYRKMRTCFDRVLKCDSLPYIQCVDWRPPFHGWREVGSTRSLYRKSPLPSASILVSMIRICHGFRLYITWAPEASPNSTHVLRSVQFDLVSTLPDYQMCFAAPFSMYWRQCRRHR